MGINLVLAMVSQLLLYQYVVSKKKNNVYLVDYLISNIFEFADCSAPFQVTFVSNAAAADTAIVNPQRGFCFEYQQIACSN